MGKKIILVIEARETSDEDGIKPEAIARKLNQGWSENDPHFAVKEISAAELLPQNLIAIQWPQHLQQTGSDLQTNRDQWRHGPQHLQQNGSSLATPQQESDLRHLESGLGRLLNEVQAGMPDTPVEGWRLARMSMIHQPGNTARLTIEAEGEVNVPQVNVPHLMPSIPSEVEGWHSGPFSDPSNPGVEIIVVPAPEPSPSPRSNIPDPAAKEEEKKLNLSEEEFSKLIEASKEHSDGQ